MWLKIGLLTTLFTYLYWALQRMCRRRQRGGCGGSCSACGGACPKPPADKEKQP